jgi:crotonobetainyl-CoA:carnitine CoA-transferase CaiB-like acyl-CoA transferase
VLAGYAAATAILGALVEGTGRRVEISLYDVALSALVNVAQGALVTGKEPARHGNAHPNIVPYEAFPTADGELAVAAANDGLFARLCEALERPDLLRFATNPERVERRAELRVELEQTFAGATADEWVERLARAGVPAGKVRGVLEALGAAALLSVEHPTIGTLPLVRSPVGPQADPAPPPLLGEHTRPVLAELGYDDDQIESLLLPSSA